MTNLPKIVMLYFSYFLNDTIIIALYLFIL